MSATRNDYDKLSLEYDELKSAYRGLSSRFRHLRSTISNKNQENIISELEVKTQELEALTNKLNLEELKDNSIYTASANLVRIQELETKIEDQNLIIRELQLEKNAFQVDIRNLIRELSDKENVIETLNSHILTHSADGKASLKSKGIFGTLPKRTVLLTRASTVDELGQDTKVNLFVQKPKKSSGKKKDFRINLAPNDDLVPAIQDELENPHPRPRSPRPINRKEDECRNNLEVEITQDPFTKSLPFDQ